MLKTNIASPSSHFESVTFCHIFRILNESAYKQLAKFCLSHNFEYFDNFFDRVSSELGVVRSFSFLCFFLMEVLLFNEG